MTAIRVRNRLIITIMTMISALAAFGAILVKQTWLKLVRRLPRKRP